MKILFLQKRPLFPANTGGKIRTLNVLKYLARWHEVTYLCNLQQDELQQLEPMRQLGLRVETLPWRETKRGTWRFYGELAHNLFSRYPYSVAKDYDPALHSQLLKMLQAERFDLVVCDFVQMARNCLDINGPPMVLFQHNVEAEIFQRHAERDRGWIRRQFMRLQANKMRRFESAAGNQFAAVVAVSERDRKIFATNYGWKHVRVIDTAVDLDQFQPDYQSECPGRIVFVGSMDWLPNQDGVVHFVKRIWPLIRSELPTAEFRIVGRNPSPEILVLSEAPGVIVEGTVADIRPHVAQAEVCVVPLRIGGGTRLKIFEAMAMQKAVVSTTLGAEGLPVTSGENLMIADDDDDFARAVVNLLSSPEKRQSLAQKARSLVQEKFSAETVARQFDAICREVADGIGRNGGLSDSQDDVNGRRPEGEQVA